MLYSHGLLAPSNKYLLFRKCQPRFSKSMTFIFMDFFSNAFIYVIHLMRKLGGRTHGHRKVVVTALALFYCSFVMLLEKMPSPLSALWVRFCKKTLYSLPLYWNIRASSLGLSQKSVQLSFWWCALIVIILFSSRNSGITFFFLLCSPFLWNLFKFKNN